MNPKKPTVLRSDISADVRSNTFKNYNTYLAEMNYGQPNFLKPIGQTRWQKQLNNLNKDLTIKIMKQK